MLVCNVSLRAPRSAIAAAVAESATALDATVSGNAVFATLIDDPASVADYVDAFTGEIMAEAATATDTVGAGAVYVAAVVEDITITDQIIAELVRATMAEAATASDVVSVLGNYTVPIAETATAVDSPDTTAVLGVSVTETATATDAPTSTAPVYATFDGTASAGVVLSNGNLTVTHGTTNNGAGVSSLTTFSSSKRYFEITVSLWGGGGSAGNGVGVGAYYTGTFSDPAGTFANGIGVGLGGSSLIFSQGTNTLKDLGSIATGDVIGAAIDLTAQLAWFRRNSGNWNNDALADPATGVGGVAFTTATVAPFVRFTNAGSADAFTGNFGQTSYANPAPSGFGNWAT